MLLAPLTAYSQGKEKVWRIGYIGLARPGTSPTSEQLFGVFVQTLRENGFVEGRNIAFERRATEGRGDRAPALAAELVSLHVDLIVALGEDAGAAAKAATRTIPIVVQGVSDPVATGLAVSLARPGGSITGLTDFGDDLQAKRFELLKAAAPRATRVAFLHEDEISLFGAAKGAEVRKKLDAAVTALGITLVRIVLSSPQDFPGAIAAVVRERVDAIVVASSGAGYIVSKELGEFAIQRRLPLMTAFRGSLSRGTLMSFGADWADIFRKAATYVAKILNGALPAELPMEQPTKVEFVINLTTAEAIGLTIPQSLLLRADEIVR